MQRGLGKRDSKDLAPLNKKLEKPSKAKDEEEEESEQKEEDEIESVPEGEEEEDDDEGDEEFGDEEGEEEYEEGQEGSGEEEFDEKGFVEFVRKNLAKEIDIDAKNGKKQSADLKKAVLDKLKEVD